MKAVTIRLYGIRMWVKELDMRIERLFLEEKIRFDGYIDKRN